MARVLIIEDNPANMKLSCLLLRHASHDVLCAVDAESGLTLARTEQPDLILMDMQLPGMDGLAATALLKKDPLTAAIPVIALTALAMKADQDRCQQAGCDGYIAKPLRYQELYAAINDLLVPADAAGADATPSPAASWAYSAAPKTRTKIAPTATQPDPDLRNQQLILVAEDNEVNQKLLLRQLALLGFAANVASNGRAALEHWQSGRYALLLTDLQMPELSGFTLATAIRAQEQGKVRMPIIALTANARSSEAEQCRLAGMDDCLSKPLQLAELKAALEVWLPVSAAATGSRNGGAVSAWHARELDLSVLEAAVGRDPAVILGFLIDFRSSLPTLAGELIVACAAGQAQLSNELAHKLKSPAHTFGAGELGALCARVEAAGRAEGTELLQSLAPMLQRELENVTADLDAFIAPAGQRPFHH